MELLFYSLPLSSVSQETEGQGCLTLSEPPIPLEKPETEQTSSVLLIEGRSP